MKTQVNNAEAQPCCKNQVSISMQSWKRLLTVTLMISAWLLSGSTSVQAQSPPLTYFAQTSDGWGFPGPPASAASGNSGGWTFTATLPAAYQYSSQVQDCPNCLFVATWSYDYHPGGAFTLSDSTYTFTGIFTSGYGYGFAQESGPEQQDLTLDMYFTGEWNTGLKEAGFMQLVESGRDSLPTGTATMAFGPAPEPGSILLFGSGIVGLAGMLRRKLRP
jgi:PEP-CTERM motif